MKPLNPLGRRGQAGVIGGIIVAVLVFSIILPLILYYQRATEYGSTQAETGIKYLEEQIREVLNVRALTRDEVTPSPGYPVIEAINTGVISVTLKRIWLINSSKVDMMIDLSGANNLISLCLNGENLTEIGVEEAPTLQPGYTLNITLKNIGLDEAGNYSFYLESDRGILHPKEGAQPLLPGRSEGELPENLSEILGPTFLDFFSFRWYVYNNNGCLTPWPHGYESFTIPVDKFRKNNNIAFGVYVCNKDPYNRTITLDSSTHMWIYYSVSSSEGKNLQKKEFYIVNVDLTGRVSSYDENNPITIGYNQVAFLVFAASSGGQKIQGGIDRQGYTNLLIHGMVDGLPFSQNIPFVGITFET